MWRETPAWRGEGSELWLDYKWIVKGWVLLLCGPWAVKGAATHRFPLVWGKLHFAPVLCSAWGDG